MARSFPLSNLLPQKHKYVLNCSDLKQDMQAKKWTFKRESILDSIPESTLEITLGSTPRSLREHVGAHLRSLDVLDANLVETTDILRNGGERERNDAAMAGNVINRSLQHFLIGDWPDQTTFLHCAFSHFIY